MSKYHAFNSLFDDSRIYNIDGLTALVVAPDGSKRWFKEAFKPRHNGGIRLYMTRSQAYKYWTKHFPETPCYTLPYVLARAVRLREDEVLILWNNGTITEDYWSPRIRKEWREEA